MKHFALLCRSFVFAVCIHVWVLLLIYTKPFILVDFFILEEAILTKSQLQKAVVSFCFLLKSLIIFTDHSDIFEVHAAKCHVL